MPFDELLGCFWAEVPRDGDVTAEKELSEEGSTWRPLTAVDRDPRGTIGTGAALERLEAEGWNRAVLAATDWTVAHFILFF